MPIIRNKIQKIGKNSSKLKLDWTDVVRTAWQWDRFMQSTTGAGQQVCLFVTIKTRQQQWKQQISSETVLWGPCPLRQLPGFQENRQRAGKVCGSTGVCKLYKWPWALPCANLCRLWRVSDGQDSDCATDGSPKRREDTPGSQASNDRSFVSGSWLDGIL